MLLTKEEVRYSVDCQGALIRGLTLRMAIPENKVNRIELIVSACIG